MKLYIIRHAEAAPATRFGPKADRSRELTDEGTCQAKRTGQVLTKLGVTPDEIWCSPLVRGTQTAKLIANAIPGSPTVKEVASLGIPGNFSDLRRQLWECQNGSLILVGHQPFLGECVQYWLSGRAHPGLDMETSSLVSLVACGFGREEMALTFILNDDITKLICANSSNDLKGS